jgi:hypothetical protein
MKGIRVLIAREDSHRSYGDALQGTIQGLRPVAEVSPVRVEEPGYEVACLESHLVACGRPNDVGSGNRARRRDSRPYCPERAVAPRPPGG